MPPVIAIVAVHHHQLAMIAMQRRPSKSRGERIDRIELDQPNSARSHSLEETAARQHRAEAVVDYIDLHALLLFRD